MPAGVGAVAGMLGPLAIIIIAVTAATAVFFAIRAPKEAHVKEDERERGIHLRGTHLAYYPLVLGCWANMIAIFYRFTRSEEHTSELQTLMRIAYAVFRLKKQTFDLNTLMRN